MNLPKFHQQPQFIRAVFHINTPTFVAGANQQEVEFTQTAFKGVLRFWWRALNWSKIRLANPDKATALKTLHEQEAELFGIASSEQRVKQKKHNGQGDCLVNALTVNGNRTWQYTTQQNGINYLLGQGLYNFRTGLTRPALVEKQSFTIDLTVNKNAKQSVLDTLKIIGLLGGFGSRSRHGFGSVTLTSLQTKSVDGDYQEIDLEGNPVVALQQLLGKYRCRDNAELPPLSAFYQGTRIDVVRLTDANAITLLNKVGEEQQMYRSYGRNGKVNGQRAEQNFVDDHNFALNLIDGEKNPITHPKRVVFGLPHNYFYSGNDTRGYSANVDASTGRRASPLILHIHKTESNQYQLISCLLKSEFLPQGATVNIQAKLDRTRETQNVPEHADWQVIESFMNRGLFANKETI